MGVKGPCMAVVGCVSGEAEMWGRGFNTPFIGGAYMSARFRCLETEHFILVIIVVCDENLKKIYLGRSPHWVPREGDEILLPILGFKKPHISALGQLWVQGEQVEGPIRVNDGFLLHTSQFSGKAFHAVRRCFKKAFLKMSWRWLHGNSRSQISPSSCLFILFSYFENC